MPAKNKASEPTTELAESVIENEIVEEVSNTEEVVPTTKNKTVGTSKTTKKLTQLNMNDLVEIKSCCYGTLSYKSNAGYTAKWPEFGSTVPMPISELVIMRNEHPGFFKNNWVVVVSDNAKDVIATLQLDRYYKDISVFEDFDDIFGYSAKELKVVLSKMNPAMKETVARRAYALIQDGVLDSHKTIEILESELGFELSDEG